MPTPDEKLEDKKEEGAGIPEAADAILKAVQESLKTKDEAPESQPDKKPQTEDQVVKWREETKKKMGWSDDQLNFHEQSIRAAQAPLMKDNAIMKMRTVHKDYDVLEKPFLAEVERYEKQLGRVIDPSLAEELFYKAKGVEITAGRYAPPESQPKKPAGQGGSSDRQPSRVARGYNPSDAGVGSDSGRDESGSGTLSQEEKDMLDFVDKAAAQVGLSVTEEDYVKARQDKKSGKREIADKAIRRLEIDPRNASPADRDLERLWNASSTTRK